MNVPKPRPLPDVKATLLVVCDRDKVARAEASHWQGMMRQRGYESIVVLLRFDRPRWWEFWKSSADPWRTFDVSRLPPISIEEIRELARKSEESA